MGLKIKKYMNNLLKFVCFVCMVGLTVVVALQVTTRQLKISLPWCEELSRFLLIWLTFSGSAVAIDEKLHLSVNFFVNLAPLPVRRWIHRFGKAVMLVFFAGITYYGFTLSSKTMGILSPTMQWPMGAVYLILPITALFIVYILVLSLFEKEEVAP